MTWVPWIEYDRDGPAVLKVVDTPLRWVLLTALGCWGCNRRGPARLLGTGRIWYRLFAWAACRAEDASTDVFTVPLAPDIAAQVKQALEEAS